MVTMCLRELTSSGTNNSAADETNADLAKELSMPAGKVDSSKLKRLMTRCVTPSNYGGPCPKPAFVGMQEFFRDFIRIAGGNHVFLTHLRNSLATAIADLNDKAFEVKTNNEFGQREFKRRVIPWKYSMVILRSRQRLESFYYFLYS